MNELALFAGAGGGILGGLLCGFKTVCAVEIEPFCREVLLRRQLDGCLHKFPIWDDVCTFNGKPWNGKIDVITGGFPCQDISSAGCGAGIKGKKSGLWKEMARIIDEVRPKYTFIENSPILISRGLTTVLCDLAEIGYDAAWDIFGAKDFCGGIYRDRIWILASSNTKHRDAEWTKKTKLPRWPYPHNRNMEEHEKARSPIDWYMEELHRQGAERENQRKSDMPPYICGVDDGVAFELDELAAIGNGQVPVVAANAFSILEARLAEAVRS